MTLPNWSRLKPLVTPFLRRSVDRIWEEDLAVEVCHDGWPGVPEAMKVNRDPDTSPGPTGDNVRIALDELSEGKGTLVICGGTEVAVFRTGDRIYAIENRCPHTGGPLYLGEVRDGHVACPWHGRRICLETGHPACEDDEAILRFNAVPEGDSVYVSRA